MRLDRLRTAGVTKPIISITGISTFDLARDAVQQGANGVILGSMTLVKAQQGQQSLQAYFDRLRKVLDRG